MLNSQQNSCDYVDLFEHAPVGYMLLNTAGCIEKINHTGAAFLGWNADWLVGKPFSRWVVTADRQLFKAHQLELSDSNYCQSHALRVKNRQGRYVSLRLESSCDTRRSQTKMCYRSIMIDVSSEQQSARNLRLLQSQLAHLARLNTAGELASSLAHELNQPLSTMMLSCDAALRMLNNRVSETEEIVTALTQAKQAATFASEIVCHLRKFLRQNGETHIVCELPPLIKDVATLIEAEARDNEIELQLQIDRNLPQLKVDSVQIEQVLLNLAHNSIEAMREIERGPRRVSISACGAPHETVKVTVADTGPGLHADQYRQIFTPFYTTKKTGMGLGLAISRTIVEAHGGSLNADSPSGRGATFHFTLPAVLDEFHAS